jgi:hypothetical protein
MEITDAPKPAKVPRPNRSGMPSTTGRSAVGLPSKSRQLLALVRLAEELGRLAAAEYFHTV